MTMSDQTPPAVDVGAAWEDGIQPEPQLGVWERFRRWLLGSPHVDAPARYVPPAPASRFTTPSKGDAYDFTVRIRWVWVGGQWRDTRLAETVEPLKADVWEQIAVATRCVLRAFPPHMAAEAEEKLNSRLDEIMRRQSPDTVARWTARAEVSPHEEVQKQQQEAWSQRLAQAAHQELAGAIVDDFAVMTAKWQELLAKVGIWRPEEIPPAFLGRYLVRLAAEPTHAAAVVDALSERREQKDHELLQAVVDAVRGVDNLNLLEADLAYDSALRRLMAWAGIPLPEPTERPLPQDEYR
jgi:hypothetical protein